MPKSREELMSVYSQVILDISEGNYENMGKDDLIDFLGVDKLKKGSRMYESLGPVRPKKTFPCPKVYVQNIDTFQKACELGSTCAVLNMASRSTPGGGVQNGSRAQEEELCRRSNLLLSLYSFITKGQDLFGYCNTSKATYPIPTFGGIYSPSVCVYRYANSYNPMGDPFLCNVISVAGVIRPDIDSKTGLLMKKYVPIVKGKIRAILRIALVNGHTKLVLGALGCGAFQNPPSHIAELFKEVLEESEFSESFEEICFAILEDGNCKRAHNPEGNLKPFADVFGLGK